MTLNGLKDENFLDDVKSTPELIECHDLSVIVFKNPNNRMHGETLSYKQESEAMANRVSH